MNSIIDEIGRRCIRETSLMEVCGTHTMAIAASGLRRLMPANLRLLSGPGCPVCVTPMAVIDWAIAAARQPGTILATFGDMVRVPGSRASLEIHHPKIVYSALDALALARDNPAQSVIFVGVGFETTIPSIAATVLAAEKEGLGNFFIIPAFKLIPPALDFIARSKKVNVDGFILPGHVSVIIGSRPYRFLARRHGMPGCITGFEPIDILQGILELLNQINEGHARIAIEYRRVVRPEGNPRAVRLMNRVFRPCAGDWRGIGRIEGSGLEFRGRYARFDARRRFDLKIPKPAEPAGCICGKILLGLKSPAECSLFAKRCTPAQPVGACMVSSEGSCAAYYRYGEKARPPRRRKK